MIWIPIVITVIIALGCLVLTYYIETAHGRELNIGSYLGGAFALLLLVGGFFSAITWGIYYEIVDTKDHEHNTTYVYEIYSGTDTNTETSEASGGFFLIAAKFSYSSNTEYSIDLRLVDYDGAILNPCDIDEDIVASNVRIYFIEEGEIPYVEIYHGRNDLDIMSTSFDWHDVDEIRVYIPESAYIANTVNLDE